MKDKKFKTLEEQKEFFVKEYEKTFGVKLDKLDEKSDDREITVYHVYGVKSPWM